MKTLLIPISSYIPVVKVKKYASFFVTPGKDSIHLLKIVNTPDTIGIIDPLGLSFGPLYQTTVIDDNSDLDQLANELTSAGFTVESSIAPGFFDTEVISKANQLNPDFLLMFTHGSHSMIEDLFGTKTSHVFEKIKCPMLVIPDDHDVSQIKKVVVGIHLDDEENFKMLGELFSLADEMKLELSFIKIDNDYQLDIVQDSDILTNLQKTYPGRVNYVVHRKAENLARGLQDYAKELHADLTVLFTTRKTFIEKLFHKSVTKDLVLHSKNPLLIYHY